MVATLSRASRKATSRGRCAGVTTEFGHARQVRKDAGHGSPAASANGLAWEAGHEQVGIGDGAVGRAPLLELVQGGPTPLELHDGPAVERTAIQPLEVGILLGGGQPAGATRQPVGGGLINIVGDKIRV